MARWKAALVEVSNRRPLSTLCLIFLIEAAVLRTVYVSAGAGAAMVATYCCLAIPLLWGYVVTKANKNAQEKNRWKRRH